LLLLLLLLIVVLVCRFSNRLEETVILTLRQYGIQGQRQSINNGVWVQKNKISALGVTASRWITMHGIALNVSCDLSPFDRIIPCGIASSEYGVCSMQEVLLSYSTDHDINTSCPNLSMAAIAHEWTRAFGQVFERDVPGLLLTNQDLDKLIEEHPDMQVDSDENSYRL